MLRIIFYLPDLNDLVDVVIWQKFDCYINQEDIKTKSKDWVKERNFDLNSISWETYTFSKIFKQIVQY